jgi:serine/threonine protein kinase
LNALPLSTQALPAGTRVEEFLIERVLGSGGFGITYLARDTRLDRQVVIKENLPVQFCFRDTHSLTVAPRHSHGDDAENFKWSLENFSKEAAMLASLDHPGIVKVLRSFEAFGTAYFVMPFVEGMALDELVKARAGEPFSEKEIRGLVERVLDALGYLHDRGIYHRDIKPGNILITNDGVPVLIDFGSARQRLSERSMTVVESPGFTPFEQLQSRGNVGPWSDFYALAATLAKILTGEAPPKANDRAFDDPWVPLSDRPNLKGRYSSALLISVDRAFAARPGDRWQDTGEWLGALIGGRHEPQQATILPQLNSPPRSARPASSLASGKIGDELRFLIGGGEEIVVKYVPGGRSLMGSPRSEADRGDDEDQVWVTLSSHYWMGETQVTQGQWMAVMGYNSSILKHGDWKKLPVESVSWIAAQEFIKKLNAHTPLTTGWKWALPTEAQWEKACRGGTTTATAFGDSLSSSQANFGGNYPYEEPCLGKTAPVKSYQPSAYGLYDMHGNVWEWCEDAYQEALPGGEDPLVSAGANRVIRGGSFDRNGGGCRSSMRFWHEPDYNNINLGFRLAAVPAERAE